MIVIISFSLEKLKISSSVCCLLRAFSSDVLIIFNIFLRNINKLTVNDSFLDRRLRSNFLAPNLPWRNHAKLFHGR